MDISTAQPTEPAKSTSWMKEFMGSSSALAKLAFLIIVLFLFILCFRLGLRLLKYFFSPSRSPRLIDGMVDATQTIIIPQDPNTPGAKTIYRSVDSSSGIEFTWSVWIYIDDLQKNEGKFKHVFSKGNTTLTESGLIQPNNAPGVYISPFSNNLVVIMNTYETINEEITISDIPLNKWVNVIIRCRNRALDIYINGTITRSLILNGVPKQNYGDVAVAMNGGFGGYISNLWYYDTALGTTKIAEIVDKGPNQKLIGSMGMSQTKSNYLSMRWYFSPYNQ